MLLAPACPPSGQYENYDFRDLAHAAVEYSYDGNKAITEIRHNT
jgi:hypothetical protein